MAQMTTQWCRVAQTLTSDNMTEIPEQIVRSKADTTNVYVIPCALQETVQKAVKSIHSIAALTSNTN